MTDYKVLSYLMHNFKDRRSPMIWISECGLQNTTRKLFLKDVISKFMITSNILYYRTDW